VLLIFFNKNILISFLLIYEMLRRKSIAGREGRITARSSRSDADDHES